MTTKRSQKRERTGKQPKKFLETDDAVRLAALIGGAEEEKSLKRVNQRKQSNPSDGVNAVDSDKSRISASKIKLKEKKAAIAQDIARAKREKKQKNKPNPLDSQAFPEVTSAPRKRVSFA